MPTKLATLPKINRQRWLVNYLQDRRRKRVRAALASLLPAPVLRAVYPDKLAWDWELPNPFKWNVWLSQDNGASWLLLEGYWMYGDARQFAPDSGGELFFIVGVDAAGIEITERSNLIRPEDAAAPGPLLTDLVAHFSFDELSGNRVDAVAGFELAPSDDDIAGATGLIGNAVAFNGSGPYLAGTEATTAFSPTANGFSVSLWANFSTVADPWNRVYLASVWDDATWPAGSPWNLSATPAEGWVTGEIVGLAAGFNGMSGYADLTGWVHLCLVFDPAAVLWSLYVNGALVATLESDDYWQETGQLGVGAHTNPVTGPPDYLVDELTFWARPLTVAEVGQLYNDGHGLAYELF